MNTNSVSNIYQSVGGSINDLYGAPIWVLIVLGTIVFGYILRIAEWFPNKKIPLVVVPFAIIINLVMMWPFHDKKMAHIDMGAWITRQIIVGMILGFVSWVLHKTLLKNLENRIPWLKGMLQDSGLDTVPPFPPQSSTENKP